MMFNLPRQLIISILLVAPPSAAWAGNMAKDTVPDSDVSIVINRTSGNLSAADLQARCPQAPPAVIAQLLKLRASAQASLENFAAAATAAGTKYSFGDESDAYTYWQNQAAGGDDPRASFLAITGLKCAVASHHLNPDGTVTPDAEFIWPYLTELPASAFSPAARHALTNAGMFNDLYDAGYIGDRTYITNNGQWWAFIGGD